MVADKPLAGFRARTSPPHGAEGDGLPFLVEVWALDGSKAEILIARAGSELLARTAYEAAVAEHGGRRITIRRGEEIVADSNPSAG